MPFGMIHVKQLRSSVFDTPIDDSTQDIIDVHDDYDNPDTLITWAVTINICSNKLINRKRWGKYIPHDQALVLLKLLCKHCSDSLCTIDFNRFVFELCPSTGNVHIHCCIQSISSEYLCSLSQSINAKYDTANYTTFYHKKIFRDEGWFQYMLKNSSNNN